MAREQRKDVDYFPHDCTHGRKMHIIEAKYGNDGYAAWFKLLEQLGKANNHYIDISDETNLMFLTSIFKISEEKTIAILKDLAKLGAIDTFLYDGHMIIYSQKFCDSIRDAYRKRKNRIFEYSDLLNEINIKTGQSSALLTQKEMNVPEVIPKEEKSKVKKSKEEDILKKFDYKKSLLKFVENEVLVNDYMALRKLKKAPITETAFNLLKNECDQNNFSLEKALEISIQQNWQGFKVEWVKNIENKEKGSAEKEKPIAGRMTETAINNSLNAFR